jgi:DNA-directed RNA polymerase specialized sigma subunit
MIEKFNKKGNRQKRNNHIKIDYDNDGGKLPQKKVVKIADVSLDDIVLATNDDSSDMHEIIRAQHDYIEDAINNKLAQHIIKTMNNKHIGKIVYYISQGFKQTEISKITGLNKDTINKYFSEFKKRFKAEYKG